MALPIRGLGAGLALLMLITLAGVTTVATPVAAVPDATCGGAGDGTTFVADSGFTVEYTDTQPIPDDGPVQGSDTIRVPNVTLSAAGDAFVRLENGTGPETCLTGINASETPIRVDPDGEQAVVIDGGLDTLSLADADYEEGTIDFAYVGSSSWTLTLESTGLPENTEIVAVDQTGSELATGIVDASGTLILRLPGGTQTVDLRESATEQEQISVIGANVSQSAVLENETVNVTAELRNVGSTSGAHTVTITSNGQTVTEETVAVVANATETLTIRIQFPQAGTYSLGVNGLDAGEVTVTEANSDISIVSASTTTAEATVNETVSVTVDLRNDGDGSGPYTATLTADGQAVTDETVTVGPNSTESITVSTTFSIPGTYNLAVDGADAGQVIISADQSDDGGDENGSADDSPPGDTGGEDEPEPTDGGDESDDSGPPWLIVLILVAIVAAIGGYLLARRAGGDSSQLGGGRTR